MKTVLGKALIAVCFLTLTSPSYSQDKQPLTWFIWDLPPEFIKSGPWKNQGYADKFLSHFIKNLPEYEHRVERVNIPRWSREVLKPNRCSAHLWGGFFPNQLLLSKPYSFTPPQVAIFHKRHREMIGPKGTIVSLEALLKKPELRLLIMRINFNKEAEQSRYPVLFSYLKPYIGKPNLIELGTLKNVANLKLLGRGRAEYTIGYPSTITTQKRVDGLSDDYIAYQLKEHNLYKNVHVACRNDSFGRGVIEKINAMLTKETLLEFLSYHDEWNGNNAEFRRMTVEYFIEGKELDNVVE